MKKQLIIIIAALMPVLFSCQALRKSLCKSVPFYDTVTFIRYDTAITTIVDTAGVVYAGRRDTIPVFKSIGVFFGSWADSLSHSDLNRHFAFEVFNYGESDYQATDQKYLKVIFDLEINNTIVKSDTAKLESIAAGYSRKYFMAFPVQWFASNPLPSHWDYRDLDKKYHYRLRLLDQDNNGKDAWYPLPINQKMPVKQYSEVYKDSVIYWVRPVVIDTTVTIKRTVYAYQDSLAFIDGILGCRIYSHFYFGGNRFYSFVVDTCAKRLYSDLSDSKTGGVTALLFKAWPGVDSADIKVYVNDEIIENGTYRQSDSLFVYLIPRPFSTITSVRLDSKHKWTISRAILNNYDLFTAPGITTQGSVSKEGDNYVFTPVAQTTSNLTANWKFNNTAADQTGRYPATISHPTEMYKTTLPCEGPAYLSFQNSGYIANCGIVPIGNEFTISFWFITYNQQLTDRPVFGNGKAYYPNGYVLLIDEISKMVKFSTGNGVTRNFIFSTDGSWASSAWQHVTITGSRLTGTGRCYINAVDRTRASSTGIFKTFPATFPLYLGRSSDDGLSWLYMDDFRIYDKILSPAEISQVYLKQDLPGGAAGNAINSLKFGLSQDETQVPGDTIDFLFSENFKKWTSASVNSPDSMMRRIQMNDGSNVYSMQSIVNTADGKKWRSTVPEGSWGSLETNISLGDTASELWISYDYEAMAGFNHIGKGGGYSGKMLFGFESGNNVSHADVIDTISRSGRGGWVHHVWGSAGALMGYKRDQLSNYTACGDCGTIPIPTGEKINITHHGKINDLGKSNGFFETYVNGILRTRLSGLKFRSVSQGEDYGKFEKIIMTYFFGGNDGDITWASPQTQWTQFGNLVVYRYKPGAAMYGIGERPLGSTAPHVAALPESFRLPDLLKNEVFTNAQDTIYDVGRPHIYWPPYKKGIITKEIIRPSGQIEYRFLAAEFGYSNYGIDCEMYVKVYSGTGPSKVLLRTFGRPGVNNGRDPGYIQPSGNYVIPANTGTIEIYSGCNGGVARGVTIAYKSLQ